MDPSTSAFDFNTPQYLGSRPATEAERRFLRRYNIVRVIRLLSIWLVMSLIAGAFLFANGLLLWLAYGLKDKPMAAQIGVGLVLLAVLVLLNAVAVKVWGKPWLALLRTRLTLPVPASLEVRRWKNDLAVESHATSDELSLWWMGDQRLDMPAHWERMLTKPEYARQLDGDDMVEIANLPGASNQAIRFPMRNPDARWWRVDPVFVDVGNIIVGLGHFSIDREIRARLPLIRGNDAFGRLWLAPALMALVLWIGAGALNNADETAKHQSAWQSASAPILAGQQVDVDALAARGFSSMQAMSPWQGKLVTAAPAKMVEMDGLQSGPFILLADEMHLIARVIDYYSPLKYDRAEGNAATFRQDLIGLVDVPDIAPEIREGLRQRINDAPDSVIQAQMRSQKMSRRPSPAFIAALLPTPAIRPDAGEPPFFVRVNAPVHCANFSVSCAQKATLRMPVITQDNAGLKLWPPHYLDKWAELELNATESTQPHPWVRWLSHGWRVSAALALLLLALHLLARRRITQFHERNNHDLING